MSSSDLRVRIIGRGRAGASFAAALSGRVAAVDHIGGRSDAVSSAGDDVDLVLVCVPDGAITDVVGRIGQTDAVVAHVAGSVGIDALGDHRRTAAIHPLVALPDSELGSRRLLSGATFAVAGDGVAAAVVELLGGRAIEVSDADRTTYHAAAAIASNHVVGLLGQAERVAATIGIPLDAYLDLVRVTVENVASLGPAAALTGPAARGDEDTIARHRAVLDPSERDAYDAMVELCRRLVDQ